MIWLLLRRLSLQLPTILLYDPCGVVLFHEGGVSKFRSVDDRLFFAQWWFPPRSRARIWALVHSNNLLPLPAPAFLKRGPFFVVEAASPSRDRFKWANRVSSERFYMKAWTFSEVLKAYATPPSRGRNTHVFCSRPFIGLSTTGPCTSHQLWYLYNTCGASPRFLSFDSREPVVFERRIARAIQSI